MKNVIKLLAIAGLLMAGLQSCIEDSRNNDMVDDQLSIVYESVVTPVSVYAGSYTVSVLKSGKGQTDAKAVVGTSSASLADYLASGETELKYKEIPGSYFRFSTDEVRFAQSDMIQKFTIDWDVNALSSYVKDDLCVLPVSILGGDLAINENRNLLALNMLKSTIEFASSGSTVVAKETPDENGQLQVKVKLDRAVPRDITFSYAVDNSLVAAYNAEKGTDYAQAPDGFVVVPSEPVKIASGSLDVFSDVTLKTSVLFSGGKMMDFRTLVVPLRITGVSLDGLLVSDKIYYLLVNSPFAGASFSRIWGKYSIDALWTKGYASIPDGGDRNLALDSKYVYFPYAVGGSTAKITAISIDDPSDVKEVNCTGFTAATITSACVRVIEKGNGSTMLVASGAGENEFPFYAWENGIDNPPTVFKLQCTWRRGGDRFEFHGTWADGILYVHAYQGRFTTRYKVVNGAFVKTDDGRFNGTDRALVNMKAEDTGFGGFHLYPGQDQMVFTTSDVSAFITLKDTYVDPGDGQKAWETSREDFPGAEMSWGYRVFSYRGDKYIAYTQIDKNDQLKEDGLTLYTTKQRARLVVVKDKGGFKASLLGDNKDIVFEAPIQGEEFTDIAVAPPTSSQGDCAVLVQSDKVLIAAGVQGLGASVFKME